MQQSRAFIIKISSHIRNHSHHGARGLIFRTAIIVFPSPWCLTRFLTPFFYSLRFLSNSFSSPYYCSSHSISFSVLYFYPTWTPLPMSGEYLRKSTAELFFTCLSFFQSKEFAKYIPVLPLSVKLVLSWLCTCPSAPTLRLVALMLAKEAKRGAPITDTSPGSHASTVLKQLKKQQICQVMYIFAKYSVYQDWCSYREAFYLAPRRQGYALHSCDHWTIFQTFFDNSYFLIVHNTSQLGTWPHWHHSRRFCSPRFIIGPHGVQAWGLYSEAVVHDRYSYMAMCTSGNKGMENGVSTGQNGKCFDPHFNAHGTMNVKSNLLCCPGDLKDSPQPDRKSLYIWWALLQRLLRKV